MDIHLFTDSPLTLYPVIHWLKPKGNTMMTEMRNKWKRDRERERKKAETHFPAGQTGSQLWSWIWPIKLPGLQAECTMLFLRNHFGRPLHGPIQNVPFLLVSSIEQPSHNSPELWSCLTVTSVGLLKPHKKGETLWDRPQRASCHNHTKCVRDSPNF